MSFLSSRTPSLLGGPRAQTDYRHVQSYWYCTVPLMHWQPGLLLLVVCSLSASEWDG